MSLPRTLKSRNIKTKQKRQTKYNLSQERQAKKYTKSRRKPKQTCAICLENVKGKKHYAFCSESKHKFHEKCINQWIDRGNTRCPTCRGELNIPYTNYYYLYGNLSEVTLDEIGYSSTEGTLSETSIKEITDYLVLLGLKFSDIFDDIKIIDIHYLNEFDWKIYDYYTEKAINIINSLHSMFANVNSDVGYRPASAWIRDRIKYDTGIWLHTIPEFIKKFQEETLKYLDSYRELLEIVDMS